MPVIVGAGSSAFEASGSSIKLPTATANLSGINTAVGTAYYNTTSDELRIYTGATGWHNAAESAALGTEGNPADSAEAIRVMGRQTTEFITSILQMVGCSKFIVCSPVDLHRVEIMDGCLLSFPLKMLSPLLETQ